MARRFRDNGGAKTFKDCAWEAIPKEISNMTGGIDDVVENITNSITDAFGKPSGFSPEELNKSADASIEASLLELSKSPDASADESNFD